MSALSGNEAFKWTVVRNHQMDMKFERSCKPFLRDTPNLVIVGIVTTIEESRVNEEDILAKSKHLQH